MLAALPLFAACGSNDAIDSEGAIFDAISPEATIFASGTEPFWGLELKPAEGGKYEARFSSPEDINSRAFAVTLFAGNNGLGFSGVLAEKPVQIAITPGDCSYGMSDRTYPFYTTLALGEATLTGCAYTSETPFTGPEAP